MMAAVQTAEEKVLNGCVVEETSNVAIGLMLIDRFNALFDRYNAHRIAPYLLW